MKIKTIRTLTTSPKRIKAGKLFKSRRKNDFGFSLKRWAKLIGFEPGSVRYFEKGFNVANWRELRTHYEFQVARQIKSIHENGTTAS